MEDPATPSSARAIFDRAVEVESVEERHNYVVGVADDAELRQKVEALLKAHAAAASFLESPAPGLAAQVTPDPPSVREVPRSFTPGTVIGPYKLLQQIGEGGYGTVFMAEQMQPVQRRVALKIIKFGMDSRQVIARFEAERQALAVMDHPNIAKVFDAGTTETGRPYFVMELVKGVPITQYSDEQHLTPRDRLGLFLQVCQAVQHAHQKGIIHRDLKPSNVLVAQYDGTPVPKVIDFGIAKATAQPLTERTLFTGFGDVIGTLEYMSPEQAEMNQLDVDTRSDIYSLGVLLYELLTGSTPLEHKRVMKAGLLEMLRVVREEEPPKPSMRLSTTEQLASISANRGMEPKKLSGLVKGELDWIVMKALEKNRGRRYETASGFATDVQRYLDDEAVQACPPTAVYRFHKFVRRNRVALITIGVIVLALATGTVVSTLQAVRARRAEAQTRTERDKALAEKVRADEEAAIAKAVNDFLQNDLLAEAAPDKNARNRKVTMEEVLGRAGARISGKFEKQPRVEAEIRQTIGRTYYTLGDYAAAQPHLERALDVSRRVLGEDHPGTLDCMHSMAALYHNQGQFAKAEPLFVSALEISRRVLGEEHPDTLNSMNSMALLYMAQGQDAKAEPLLAKALEVKRRILGEESSDTIESMNSLAALYQNQGQFAKAEPLFVQTLEVKRRVLGEEHPSTLLTMNNLAIQYQQQHQFTKAEPLLIKTLEVKQRVLGEEHPSTLISMNNLAGLYLDHGQHDKAEPLFVKALEVSRRNLGEDHPDTLMTMSNLALQYRRQGQYAKAEPLLVKTLDVKRRVLGAEHPATLISAYNLAGLYQTQSQVAEAEALFVKTLEASRRVLNEQHPLTLNCMNSLADLYEDQDEFAKAEPLYREALEKTRKLQGQESPAAADALSSLALNMLKQKKYADAEPLLVAGYEAMKQREAKIPADGMPELAQALERLVQLYDAWGKKDQADTWRRKLEAHRAADQKTEEKKEK